MGLNEQELLFLSHSSGQAPHASYFTDINGQPDLPKIIDILEWTLTTFGKSHNNNSKFTRIHFHSLLYHIIALIETNEWSNTVSSLITGAKIASKQAAGLEFYDEENEEILHDLVHLRIDRLLNEEKNILFKIADDKYVELNSSRPVIEFNRGRIKFFFTPVLVCKIPVKTVGLGDAISSMGLLYNSYNHLH